MKTAAENYYTCLLGKVLNCNYHEEPNYLEIDVDIGSSAIVTTILGWVTMVTVDMGIFVAVRGELPNRLFGTVRICQIEMNSVIFVNNAMQSKKVLLCEDESKNEDE
ncbi:hypothetical protein Fot_07825 [Forsythia ovata]|uniref:Protein ENHANCED DISEASE RESISTANCE 2 C-terminal domain-containing protein n=1 Tax=Forsythia ovata TaxID=205694 RepID=A0ABD1WWX4_9LAMI